MPDITAYEIRRDLLSLAWSIAQENVHVRLSQTMAERDKGNLADYVSPATVDDVTKIAAQLKAFVDTK